MSGVTSIGCPYCGASLSLDPATHAGHADGSCVAKRRRPISGIVADTIARIDARKAAADERARADTRGSQQAQAALLVAAEAKRSRKNAKRVAVKPDTLAQQLRGPCPYCGQMLAIHESRSCGAGNSKRMEGR